MGKPNLALMACAAKLLLRAQNKPVQILVGMDNPAGIFQTEKVLERKLKTSRTQDLVDVIALKKWIEIRRTI